MYWHELSSLLSVVVKSFLFLFNHIHVFCSLFFPFLPHCRKLIIWVDRPLPLWALQVRQISTLLCKQGLSLFIHITACQIFQNWICITSFQGVSHIILSGTSIYTSDDVHVCTHPDHRLLHLNLFPLKLNHQHAYWFHPRSTPPSLQLLISLRSGLTPTILTLLCVCISQYLYFSLSLSLFYQVLVAFISFSETMLLVYLSYKVSYLWPPTANQ